MEPSSYQSDNSFAPNQNFAKKIGAHYDVDSEIGSQSNTLKIDSYLNTSAMEDDADEDLVTRQTNKANVNKQYIRPVSQESGY